MRKTTLGLCAGAWVLLLAAGCASSDVAGMLSLQSGGDDRVVSGSLDTVAKSTTARLQALHLDAQVTRNGEAFHITSKAPNGSRFKLVLTSEKVGSEERTKIKMEWLDKREENVARYILSSLEYVSPQ